MAPPTFFLKNKNGSQISTSNSFVAKMTFDQIHLGEKLAPLQCAGQSCELGGTIPRSVGPIGAPPEGPEVGLTFCTTQKITVSSFFNQSL